MGNAWGGMAGWVRSASATCTVASLLALTPVTGLARMTVETAALPGIALTQLPVQGRKTYLLIREGGPFPYEKDGSVFGNRERILPAHKRGYYREYTVRTPGVRGRGGRRIVCGGTPRTPDACYYTADHYASFQAIHP